MTAATETAISLSTDEITMLEAMMAKADKRKAEKSQGVSKADYWTHAAKSLETKSETTDLIRERRYHQTGDQRFSTYR